MSRDQFRIDVRDRVQELIEGDERKYLGTGAHLHELSLDGPDGNLTVVFTDPSRPGRLQVWTWAFPGLPPANHVPTADDVHAYAGWVGVCLLEVTTTTRRGITSVPEQR